jgi:predicted GH43/DUF377 family glycosyl hydrolase
MIYPKLTSESYLTYFEKKDAIKAEDSYFQSFKNDVIAYNANASKIKEATQVLSRLAEECFDDPRVGDKEAFEMTAKTVLDHLEAEQVYAILFYCVNNDGQFYLDCAQRGTITILLRRLAQYKQA